MKIFLMMGLLAGSAFASDDHGAEGGARTGPTKAVLEASAEHGLKLSDKAVKRLGLKTTRLGADMRVPPEAVLYFKEEAGIYVSRSGWYKLVEVEVAAKSKRAVTVKQLLSMSSGVHNDPGIGQREDLFSYALKIAPMDHEPGAKWDYNNTGLALLSPVFQKATGKQIDEFLNERVFRPIGIAADDLTWERQEGFALPYAGCHTTARSLGRIGLLVRHHGKWNDKQIVPAAWLSGSIAASQELNKSYGYLWWNNTTNKWPNVPKDAFAALGRWANNIFVAPSLDLIVIRQSDLAPPAKDYRIADYFQLVCGSVTIKD